MNFYNYIERSPDEFGLYLSDRLVQKSEHPEFPLDLYCYGRKAVYDNVWDTVTMKCRGIIVHRVTGEIIARPFEKFFNLGSANMPDTDPLTWDCNKLGNMQPVVWEKLDGFLCILYHWEGKNYIASKGSFTSPHAKWATNWIQSHPAWSRFTLPGCTPVFEGITSNLRIVVDYGKLEGLVLTAIIKNETGEEYPPSDLRAFATEYYCRAAIQFDIPWQEAAKHSLDESVKNEEGYVLTWYRKGTTPFRLKVKFQDYLRLHRLVTGVGPKRILEALMGGWGVDFMENDAPEWFKKYVSKWKTVIETEYNRIEEEGERAYDAVHLALHTQDIVGIPTRKDWALLVQRPEFKNVSAIVFARMDGKPVAPIIWKMVKNSDLLKSGKPMIDQYAL